MSCGSCDFSDMVNCCFVKIGRKGRLLLLDNLPLAVFLAGIYPLNRDEVFARYAVFFNAGKLWLLLLNRADDFKQLIFVVFRVNVSF